jgi:hypothetical protein
MEQYEAYTPENHQEWKKDFAVFRLKAIDNFIGFLKTGAKI